MRSIFQAGSKAARSASGRHIEKTNLSLGFIPLTDCAPLVVAMEQGFFRQQGLNVELSRENSWANIRDKVSIGMLDGAQMLAPMPLASALGIGSSAPMITALSLGLNGNGITVSSEIYQRLLETEQQLDNPVGSGRAMKQVIETNRATGGKPLMFATVFPYSSHNYLLRYWLASAGIDPDQDIALSVVPPSQMVNYLQAGVISGFCVGEPWNTLAASNGLGHTLAASYDIWNNHPEKVFGVATSWAAAYPNTHHAILIALIEACRWIDREENRRDVCELLSQGRYVNTPQEILERSMLGDLHSSQEQEPIERQNYNLFYRYSANFPWRSQALWFLTQMARWGQLREPTDLTRIAHQVYRPELYYKAATELNLVLPGEDYKPEGMHANEWTLQGDNGALQMGPDQFFDGLSFNAHDPAAYLERFSVAHIPFGIEALKLLNPLQPAGRAATASCVDETEEATQ